MAQAGARRRDARASPGALVAALVALPCAGCLTITSSSYQRIPVATEPPGATARSGEAACRTPCELEVDRAEAEPIEVALDGYQPVAVPLQRHVRGAWAWNLVPPVSLVLVAVPPLWTADFLSGAAYGLEPERLALPLRPLEADPPAVPPSGEVGALAPAPAEAGEARPADGAPRPGAASRSGSGRRERWPLGRATLFWSALQTDGLGVGLRLLLPPWEIGVRGGWHALESPLQAWDLGLQAGAGADLAESIRATLLAEGGYVRYWVVAPSSSGWISSTSSRVLEGGSASFPFVGARAILGFRLGRRGWLTFGLTGFAWTAIGSEEIPYAIETCSSGWFGGRSCSTESGVVRAGRAIYGAGLVVGSRFDWNAGAAAPPTAP